MMRSIIGIGLATTVGYYSNSAAQSQPAEELFLCPDREYTVENNREAINTFRERLGLPVNSLSPDILVPDSHDYMCPTLNTIFDANPDGKISRHELSDPKLLNQAGYFKHWGMLPP